MTRRDEERRWRSTFTRENREGERRLFSNLRNQGAMRTGEAIKRAELAAQEADFQSARAETRAMAAYYAGNGNVDASVRDPGPPRARLGVRTRTVYLPGRKIEQIFDGEGNMLSETETPLP